MKVSAFKFESSFEYLPSLPFPGESVDLVLLFGLREIVEADDLMETIRAGFPAAKIAGCSSAGELFNGEYAVNSLVVMAIVFEGSRCEEGFFSLKDVDSGDVGTQIADRFAAPDLKAMLLFSEGLETDCESVVNRLGQSFREKNINPHIFGGLAGDNLKLEKTVVVGTDGLHHEGIVVLGLYGEQLQVLGGSSTDWPLFDKELNVTRGDDNLVHEFDGRPAVEAYAEVLGEPVDIAMKASRFHPIILTGEQGTSSVARTIFSFDAETGAMLFAGSVSGRVKVANFESPNQFLDGVSYAMKTGFNTEADLVLAVSCVGRRLSLGASVFLEAEPFRAMLPPDVPSVGFYGYGEVGYCPEMNQSQFLNHSFTVLCLHET